MQKTQIAHVGCDYRQKRDLSKTVKLTNIERSWNIEMSGVV